MFALWSAAQAKVPDVSGSYDLKAADIDKVAAKPGCIEHWHLRRDGSLVVESDQEQVSGRWQVTPLDKTVLRMTWTHRTTNGLPDCWGRVSEKPGRDVEFLFYLNSLRGLVLVKLQSAAPETGAIYEMVAVTTKVGDDK